MSYFVKFRGLEVRCETVADLEAIARAARSSPATVKAVADRAKPQADSPPKVDAKKIMRIDRSAVFLAAIREAGQKGIGGSRLVKAVGCNGPAGLGTVVQVTRQFLDEVGVNLDDVAVKDRRGDDKLWVPAAHIDSGIEALEKLAKTYGA